MKYLLAICGSHLLVFKPLIFVCLIVFFTVVLDGREINEITRRFLINWKACKEAKERKKNKHVTTGLTSLCPLTSEYVSNPMSHLF